MIYSRILGKVSEGCWLYNDVGCIFRYTELGLKIALSLNPLTLKISLVILLTVRQMILIMQVRRIWFWIN